MASGRLNAAYAETSPRRLAPVTATSSGRDEILTVRLTAGRTSSARKATTGSYPRVSPTGPTSGVKTRTVSAMRSCSARNSRSSAAGIRGARKVTASRARRTRYGCARLALYVRGTWTSVEARFRIDRAAPRNLKPVRQPELCRKVDRERPHVGAPEPRQHAKGHGVGPDGLGQEHADVRVQSDACHTVAPAEQERDTPVR